MKNKPSAINLIWLVMILLATVVAAYKGTMAQTTAASFNSAKSAVTLAIALIGAMAFWLGIMRVLEVAGLMRRIARLIRPVMIRLFPEVPTDHPAMSAMIMNMAANALGLGNAATPMGIKAMQGLEELNPNKGTATNAMCLFLAINTSSVTLLPLGVITIRAAAGATNPSAIIITSILATACSTIAAIFVAKFMAFKTNDVSLPVEPKKKNIDFITEEAEDERHLPGLIGKIVVTLFIVAFVGAIGYRLYLGNIPSITSPEFFTSFSNWLIPFLICAFLVFGFFNGVRVYETLTDGAKEGFQVAIKIIPFMVAIFVAIGMIRASGALDLLVDIFNPVTSLIGMPAEALSVALMRPLSGTGSFGIMAEIVNSNPNSFLSYLVSTMQGSTETTFYVLAVYFGSVGITRTRYALPAALCADVVGILASVLFCHIFF